MIKLVKSKPGTSKYFLTSIEGVPDRALAIVGRYETLFDHKSVRCDDGWKEFSDLSEEEAVKLRDELRSCGFECEIVENKY